ncbi:hypothetical protein B0F90DRAFT_1617325, partial [Multifurca ochricompacta]
ENELTTRQSALIDSAFEEGQYESGIAMLEQLCSPRDYPSKSHIRQLLYIALYPPSSAQIGTDHKATQESPSKLSSRHAYSTLLPSPAASELAKRTLRVLADVNSPASLLRALPAYPDLSDGGPSVAASAPDSELPSDVDSFVASEAIRFRDCKNCWNILKVGFIRSLSCSTITVPKSPRKRRLGESTVKGTPVDEGSSSVVGENAWPVLDWLLLLFEKDEFMTETSRRVRYSPLLLSQIPPTRSDAGSKWDANDPLEIVFHCFKQQDESRREIGSRLLTLLINLTSTNLFDLPLFMNLLIPRLPSGASEMRDLLSGISSTPTLCKFKVALCQRYLSRARVGDCTSMGRSRPRAQPRPITGRSKRAAKKNSIVPTTPDPKPQMTLLSDQSQHTLPPVSELLHLLTMKTDTVALSNTIKYDLLVTYGFLQHQAATEDKNQDWMEILRNGRLVEAIDGAF